MEGNKAHYKHQGVEYSVKLPNSADDEAIAHAVNTHIKSRLQAEPSEGWRGHGPVDPQTESDRDPSWTSQSKGADVFDMEKIRSFIIECCHDNCKRGVGQEVGALFQRLDRQSEEIEMLKETQVLQARRVEQLVQSINTLNGIVQGILGVRVNIASNGAITPTATM